MSFFCSFVVSSAASDPLCSMTGPLVDASCDAHLVRQDVRQRGLAEARRARQEDVVERLAALLRRRDEHLEVLGVLGLPDVVVEGLRAERAVELRVVARAGPPSRARAGAAGFLSAGASASSRH